MDGGEGIREGRGTINAKEIANKDMGMGKEEQESWEKGNEKSGGERRTGASREQTRWERKE